MDPYRRVDDAELVGYLVEEPDGVVPLTLFGVPLGPASSRVEAEALLRARGMAALAEPWLLRQEDGDEVRVAVLAAYPDRVLVVPAPYGYAHPKAVPIVVLASEGPSLLRPWT